MEKKSKPCSDLDLILLNVKLSYEIFSYAKLCMDFKNDNVGVLYRCYDELQLLKMC